MAQTHSFTVDSRSLYRIASLVGRYHRWRHLHDDEDDTGDGYRHGRLLGTAPHDRRDDHGQTSSSTADPWRPMLMSILCNAPVRP